MSKPGVAQWNGEPHACETAYRLRLEEFFPLSGVETRWAPLDHFPVGHANRIAQQTSWARKSTQQRRIGTAETAWLEVLFTQAREFLAGCRAVGGRLWESEIRTADYVHDLPADLAAALTDLVSPEMRYLTEKNLPDQLARIAVCTPANCERDSVRGAVAARYVGRLLCGFDIADLELFLPPPPPNLSDARELTDWSALSLDFAITGVQMCGTSSLWQNLEQHPEIGFTHGLQSDTDFFFTDTMQRRLLPLKEHVETFNGQWTAERPRPTVVGIRHSMLLQYPIARFMLSQIPRVVAIAIACDPVGRAERNFINFCKNIGKGNCGQEIVPFFGTPTYWKDGGVRNDYFAELPVGHHLREMHYLFGKRFALFHQDRLRKEPSEFYNFIAQTVGATKAFDYGYSFGRYNAYKGHRSELCRNTTLVQRFRNQLMSEYIAQEELLPLMGERVPEVVLRRKTRCDRFEDLAVKALACNQFTRCD